MSTLRTPTSTGAGGPGAPANLPADAPVLHAALAETLRVALASYDRHDERGAVYAVAEGAALLPRLHACLDPGAGELPQRLAALYRYLHLELEQVARHGDAALLERLVGVALALCPADRQAAESTAESPGESCRDDPVKVSATRADSR